MEQKHPEKMTETSRAEFKYLVERQREEIKTLNEVGRLLSNSQDPNEIIIQVASYLARTFPVALFGIVLLEQKSLHLIHFAKISQVDIVSAVRQLYANASERLHVPIQEKDFNNITLEVNQGTGQWAQTATVYLRSSYFSPLAIDGKTIGLIGIYSGKPDAFTKEDQHVVDIVANQLRAALRNALLLEELKKANQLKNDILMIISHELRIPLTSIKEGVSLILEKALGPITADQQDFLTTVSDNTHRLEMLVEKAVMASQLLTNQIQYSFQETDLMQVIQSVESDFRLIAQAKSLKLEIKPSEAARCMADPMRIKQALSNIVENSIQATPPEGTVIISINYQKDMAAITVNDNGTGIPQEELPRIFEQFKMVGGVNDRKTGGLGLGLFITKTIIDAHHGLVEIQSQTGQGTKVTLFLPKHQP